MAAIAPSSPCRKSQTPLAYLRGSVESGADRAVTVSKRFLPRLLFLLAATLQAQQSYAIHKQLVNVAISLSHDTPDRAMEPFDKSFDGYSTLLDYFRALTDAYTIVNQVDITDEDIEGHEATLTVHWTMNLNDKIGQLNDSREGDLTIKLSMNMKKGDWKIVDLSPVEFFNPAARKSK